MSNNQGSCVIIVNRTDTPFLRHVVTTNPPYEEESFKTWYYGCGYQRLTGDEFIFCPSKADYESMYSQLKEEENRLYGQPN